MKVTIAIGVSGRNDVTRRFIDTTLANCYEPHEFIIVSNGSTDEENTELNLWLGELEESNWETCLVMLPEPVGSSAALNTGIKVATGDIIVLPHNDLLIKQDAWDMELQYFFSQTGNVGMVGFAGGKSIGGPDIYRTPYVLTQLARGHVYTALEDWQSHGAHCTSPIKVAVLDGLTMCARKSVLDEVGGFDKQMIHHMYDADVCLKAIEAGYDNYVIPILCQHLSGQTANFSNYNEWLRKQGYEGDGEVHKLSHEYFYKKWWPGNRGITLPLYVE